MKEYQVSWHIDILANSPREAAEKALVIQKQRYSYATIFNVNEEGCHEFVAIDLDEDESE